MYVHMYIPSMILVQDFSLSLLEVEFIGLFLMLVTFLSFRTLVTMLKVFTNFQNPKSVHKKDDLWTLYMKVRNLCMQ